MRHSHASILQQDSPLTRTGQALRLASRGCGWIGEAFIGLSLLLLCKAGKLESAGDSGERKPGLLLPRPIREMDSEMKELKVRLRCAGCSRDVEVLVQIEGMLRCDDCRDVAGAEDKANYYLNAGNN